jgi:predicted AAA+ superfamily ATPase
MAAHLYPRRELAKHYLQLLLDRPHTALSLFGPRQIGKTTFITGDLSAWPPLTGFGPSTST